LISPRSEPERGFTYVGLLLAIALAGAALAGFGVLWSKDAQREREIELLFVGEQFRDAIAAYYEKAPAGQRHRFPEKLDDLVQDKRWPVTRRHLRKIFVDPMTNSRDWGLVKTPGGIVGVHSLSGAVPLKRAGFSDELADFAAAKTYRDWRFVHVVVGAAPGGPSPGAQPASPRQVAAQPNADGN
jgi:type II secretory pathway pseudopilin PulG